MSSSQLVTGADRRPLISEFTVGWITAIQSEFLAARVALDEEYSDYPFIQIDDCNTYTLGRIGKFNVVIATLPAGSYGTQSTIRVADGLKATFPFVKTVLMVGVAGGAPTVQNDVRLGDVVVGTKVIPYDFVKVYPHGSVFNGAIYTSSHFLLSGTQKLEYDIASGKIDLDRIISTTFVQSEQLRDIFRRPEDDSDRLYPSRYRHNDASCECLNDRPRGQIGLVTRLDRKDYDRIKVHRGAIGAADKVIKDATTRDDLIRQFQIFCVEMESAALVDRFTNFLPIRGICDYADSHKNKQWQGYAAAAAAVYAKCLLSSLTPVMTSQALAEMRLEDLQRYLEVISRKVKQVTSTSIAGSDVAITSAENAMREIQQSVTMLLQMAEENKKNLASLRSEAEESRNKTDTPSKQQNRNTEGIVAAQKDLKELTEGQQEMKNSLEAMTRYIEQSQAQSPPEQKKDWNNLKQQAKRERSSLEKAIKCSKVAGEAVDSIVDILTSISRLTKDEKMRHILSVIQTTNNNIGKWANKFKPMPSITRSSKGSILPSQDEGQSSPKTDSSTERRQHNFFNQIPKVQIPIFKTSQTERDNGSRLQLEGLSPQEDLAREETGGPGTPSTPHGKLLNENDVWAQGPLTPKRDQSRAKPKPRPPPKPRRLMSSPKLST